MKYLTTLLLCVPLLTTAQVYKCLDKGKTTYQQEPCAKGIKESIVSMAGAGKYDPQEGQYWRGVAARQQEQYNFERLVERLHRPQPSYIQELKTSEYPRYQYFENCRAGGCDVPAVSNRSGNPPMRMYPSQTRVFQGGAPFSSGPVPRTTGRRAP